MNGQKQDIWWTFYLWNGKAKFGGYLKISKTKIKFEFSIASNRKIHKINLKHWLSTNILYLMKI